MNSKSIYKTTFSNGESREVYPIDVLVVSKSKLLRKELQQYFNYWSSFFNVEVSETFPEEIMVYPLTISDEYPFPNNVDYYILVIYPKNITTRDELFKYGYFALIKYNKVLVQGKLENLISAIFEKILRL